MIYTSIIVLYALYKHISKLVYIKSIEKETLIKTNSTLKNQETKNSYKKTDPRNQKKKKNMIQRVEGERALYE